MTILTWFWNIRHRRLIEETKARIRFYQFLRCDCGLKYADRLLAKELKRLLNTLKSFKIGWR